jgi:hypothetical protein
MRRNILLLVLAGVSAATFLSTKSLVTKGQRPQTPQSIKETLDERLSRLPITDFTVQEPADREMRRLRRARNQRNNLSAGPEVKRTALNDAMEPVLLHLTWTHQPDEPAIPAGTSDAVVTGTVNEANAYISSDRIIRPEN